MKVYSLSKPKKITLKKKSHLNRIIIIFFFNIFITYKLDNINNVSNYKIIIIIISINYKIYSIYLFYLLITISYKEFI